MKIYHVQQYMSDYSTWIPNRVLVDKIEDADVVIFEGGSDLSPSLYGEKAHYTTNPNPSRDTYEVEVFKKALSLNKPMLGVCRGAQFLCVMAGGRLVQDMSQPGFKHPMRRVDGKTIMVSSSHHQLQFPHNLPEDNYKILGWADNLSKYHLDGDGKEMNPPVEVERAYYPKINALSIQDHPEYCYPPKDQSEAEYIQATIDLFNNFMAGKL